MSKALPGIIQHKKNITYKSIISIPETVCMVMALFIIFWLNQGIFTYIQPYLPRGLEWGIYLVWLSFLLLFNRKYRKIFFTNLILLIAFYFIILLFVLIRPGYTNPDINKFAYLIMVYSMFLYYWRDRHINFQKIVVIGLLFDYVFVGINTFIQLNLNPNISRILSTSSEIQEAALGGQTYYAIGSYGYFYALVPLIIFLTFSFLNSRKYRLESLALIIGFLVLLTRAAFTTIIIAILILLTILIVFNIKKLYIKLLVFLSGLTLIAIFVNNMSNFFLKVSEWSSLPDVVSIRFIELSMLFANQSMLGTDIVFRQSLYQLSWHTFIAHPMFGVLGRQSGFYSQIGGHSEWLDNLAAYGICSIFIFAFLYKAYKYCAEKMPREMKLPYNLCWAFYICIGFINPIFSCNTALMWFLIVPFMITASIQLKK